MYPDAPVLFPRRLRRDVHASGRVGITLLPPHLLRICEQLHDGSKEYFRTTHKRLFKQSLEAFVLGIVQPFAKDADPSGKPETL